MKPKATRSMAQLVRVLDRMFIVLLKEMYLEIRLKMNWHQHLALIKKTVTYLKTLIHTKKTLIAKIMVEYSASCRKRGRC